MSYSSLMVILFKKSLKIPKGIKTEFQNASPKLIMVRNPDVERFQL
jgi:hypothetical protein